MIRIQLGSDKIARKENNQKTMVLPLKSLVIVMMRVGS